ncbi:hypothetical protein J6590_019516 [Homalodisca vitripennis]|nr:hypothetical protein J6590_019516 [Homalodisca vitripennis]
MDSISSVYCGFRSPCSHVLFAHYREQMDSISSVYCGFRSPCSHVLFAHYREQGGYKT